MPARVRSREPLLVDSRYVYVTGDALRTVGALGPLWTHHVHGNDIDESTITRVAAGLRADVERHAAFRCDDADLETMFGQLGDFCAQNFDAMSDTQVVGVIESIWRHLPRLRKRENTASGEVATLHTSRGGVPKKAVDAVEIDIGGVVGDKQANRTHHGRPWQAVCLWSKEVVDAFAAAGHPLRAGCAGENVSVSGIDWSLVRPGTFIEIGEAELHVTAYSIPCSKNAAWFSDRDFQKMSHERGWVSRVYALVRRPGRVAAGDSAIVRY